MALASYSVKVPGSLMLFGEHAVLHGKWAIVAAINRYLKVSLTPRADNRIEIFSSGFPGLTLRLDRFKIVKPYEYVLTAIKLWLPKLPSGFTLQIEADFPSNLGFGSSAAVSVATLGVLTQWLTNSKNNQRLYRQALAVVRSVQGCGSGADVAASIFGGVIAYRARPLAIEKISNGLPLVAVYSGSKMLTPLVIGMVERERQRLPAVFSYLYSTINSCTKEAIAAITQQQYSRLGKLMNIHQGLQDALGVNNAKLAKIVFGLREEPQIYGAKISGAGLGDCVIGLGKVREGSFSKNRMDIKVSAKGMVYS